MIYRTGFHLERKFGSASEKETINGWRSKNERAIDSQFQIALLENGGQV
jgi:hypothetical protein